MRTASAGWSARHGLLVAGRALQVARTIPTILVLPADEQENAFVTEGRIHDAEAILARRRRRYTAEARALTTM